MPEQGPADSFNWQPLTSQSNDLGPNPSQGHWSGAPGDRTRNLLPRSDVHPGGAARIRLGEKATYHAGPPSIQEKNPSQQPRAKQKWAKGAVGVPGEAGQGNYSPSVQSGPWRTPGEPTQRERAKPMFLIWLPPVCTGNQSSVSLKSLPILQYLYAQNKQALFFT